MKMRILPVALVAALAACDASPTAPGLTRADNGYAGAGDRDLASTSSILLGGGTRTDPPTTDDPGNASTSSALMGGGTRTDQPPAGGVGSASTSSVYMGGGARTDEPAERNPFLGGTGG